MTRLKNKVAVITGGGSGIGKAIALKFAAKSCFVHILDKNIDEARETVREISETRGEGEAHLCDVSNQEEVINVFKAISDVHPVDILVNNAGIAHVGNLENTTEENMDLLYSVNVKGVYNCMHAAIGGMVKNGSGVILNMASIASTVGISDRFAYSMTKGAVLTMTYSVAKDYIGKGIRCNCISPARIHTPFVDGFIKKNYPGKEKEMFEALSKTQPIGRMGEPEEVASLALFLCSDEASFITGTDYPLDGGFIRLNG
ncbi:MAG: glucose 1-dehydrogenase [Bacteroidetes bacterium]|nr:glucose 1-dehydrogenase [Bacteroidota bacterium]MCH8233057.1 glucose 1-dehydrogenase [Bacteroidota bacterium]